MSVRFTNQKFTSSLSMTSASKTIVSTSTRSKAVGKAEKIGANVVTATRIGRTWRQKRPRKKESSRSYLTVLALVITEK